MGSGGEKEAGDQQQRARQRQQRHAASHTQAESVVST